jgi:tetratricopeptide (TPR) repeat protein
MRERLKLFLRVCEGVSHAHRHLIIHRDLKPSNILVNAAGQPKLLDFGIAKLVNEPGDVTQTAEQLLTPDYASPEQMRGEAQSTATDVYSLGAVLYQLLTGAAPREHSREIGKVNPEIPTDLDFVVRKALRPEPEERYVSVDEFASDVRAVLERRPVQARGDDVWYRMRRRLRRYWMPMAAGIAATACLSAGLWVANRERAIAQRRFADVRQLANKFFEIEYETRKLAGGTKASQMIVDTSLQYLRRLEADLHGDPGLALEMGNAYLRVARVQGIPTGRNLGQMDQAEQNLGAAEKFIRSVLAAQPRNRMAILRLAQIIHDRMLLARYNGRYDEALILSGKSEEWLEKFAAGKADKAEMGAILNTYLNLADQNARGEHYDEALRLCRRATDLTTVADRLDYVPDFLWITADVHRRQGDLDQALKELDEAVRLSDPRGAPEVWRTINYCLGLICRGDLLGEDNALSLGRPKEALESLEHAFRLADDLAHRDPYDQISRSRIANAGISVGGILRKSDPAHALAVYDHTFRHVAEIQNNSSFRRFEVSVLAGSSYALRKLGRPAEARRRLDAAFERLRQLKLYPAENFKLGSEVEDSLRALADYEAATGNLHRAVEVYQKLLDQVRPAKSSPETSLTDAVRLSTIYRGASAVQRRAGLSDRASILEARDRKLWQLWDRALPNNTFVRRHLTE